MKSHSTDDLWFSASEAKTNTRKRAPVRARRPRSAANSSSTAIRIRIGRAVSMI
jgi:hypothetical protein